MREGSWRARAAPIIRAVLLETAGQAETDVRRALREAYPFGKRAMYPYKAWCSEVQRQRGRLDPRAKPSVEDDPQLALFPDEG